MLILNRRELIKMLAAVPLAHALSPEVSFAASAGTGKNVIFINLVGGYDAFAMFPYARDPNVSNQSAGFVEFMRNNRPDTFILPQNRLTSPTVTYMANDHIGFAPGWAPIYPEFSQGRIKLIQSIGIQPGSFPNGSHNVCENIYSFGNKDYVGGVSRAWFARLMEQMSLTENQSFAFGTLGRPDFITEGIRPPLVGTQSENMRWVDPLGNNRRQVNVNAARQLLSLSSTTSPAQEKILNSLGSSLDASDLMDQMITATDPSGPKRLIGNYPATGYPISPTLKSIARVISYYNGDNKNRLFYALHGGWDTHENQGGFDIATGLPVGQMHANISAVAGALRALIDDLKNPARPVWDKTIIVIFSEFGRGVRQDGSRGTDHGHASTFMVLGGPVSGGVAGTAPTLSVMEQYNWSFPQVAFQNLFAPVISWFGGNANEIFPTTQYQVNADIANSIIR